MDEKKPQYRGRLPEGVPPEAIRRDDSRPFTDALVTGSGWPRLSFYHWLVPLTVVLLIAVAFVQPLVAGSVSLGESRLLEVLTFFVVLLSIYGVGIVLGRRRYRRDGDLPRARKLVLQVVVCGWGGLAVVLGVAHFFGGFALRSVYLSMTPAVVGGLLVWGVCLRLGLLGERGVDGALRCAACDYPYEGAGSDRCPECGAAWHEPGSLLARHSKQERWNPGAVVCYVVLFVVIVLSVSQREKFYAITPTGRLVASVGVHGESYDRELWEHINGRALTQAQTTRLAERILDEPAADRLNSFASDWLYDRLVAGEIPQDHIERFISDRVVLTLEASPSGPGEMRVVVTAEAVGWAPHRLRFELAGIGISVDGGPPAGRAASYRSIRHSRTAPEARTTRWVYRFTGLDAGERSLRFECWVVLMHGSSIPRAIVWQGSGIPSPVQGAIGAKRLEASTTISVPE